MNNDTYRYERALSDAFSNENDRIRYIYDNPEWKNLSDNWLRDLEYEPMEDEEDGIDILF